MIFLNDLNIKVIKPELKICKNDLNRTTIGEVQEAYDVEQKLKLGNISELSFSIPFSVFYRNTLSENKLEPQLKERRIIKFVKGSYVEYYIIHKITKESDDDGDFKRIECYSLGYELNDKMIRDYSVVSYNTSQILNDVLGETNWTTDYIDADFDIMYRSFEFSSGTVLDAVQKVAETFGALIIYDTENRTVSFYNFDNYGQNRGLSIEYGKLLKNITYETNTSEYATRLYLYGKDGLTIRSVNPTSTAFIDDFSSILRGFQRDANKNVISSASDISDSLANALLDYQELVESKGEDYQFFLEQLNIYNTQLIEAKGELTDLEADLQVIEDSLVAANVAQDQSQIAALVAQLSAKRNEIDDKEEEIVGIETNINNVNSSIDTLSNTLDLDANFTPEQLIEWNNHIVTREYTNEYIDDPEQLLEYGKQEIKKLREPKIVVSVDIVNFLEIVSEHRNWNKLNLGDIVTINHEKIGVNISAKIIQIEFDYENAEVNLEIGNVKEILNDMDRFIKGLYDSVTSSKSYSENKYKYLDGFSKANSVYQEIQQKYDANKREIVASNNNEVEISRKGIRIYDPSNTNNVVILQSGIVSISGDGGNTWRNALTKDGLVAERLYGQVIAGNDLTIESSSGLFTFNANGATIKGAALTIEGGLTSDHISEGYTSALENYAETITQQVRDDLQSQIDGNITTWFYDHEPTLSNLPASDWITEEDKNRHLGDIFYDENTGYAYRFTFDAGSSTYKWVRITDSDITKALNDASKALDTADNKRRVFITTPTPPYDVGDLWQTDGNVDLKICKTAKTESQTYSASDWVFATNAKGYIDGEITELNNAISNFQDSVDELSSDGKLTRAEANILENDLAQVKKESDDIISVSTQLEISTERTDYSNALSALETELNNNWINQSSYPRDITSAQRNAIKTKFENVQGAKTVLINKITEVKTNLKTNLLQNGGAEISTGKDGNNIPDGWSHWTANYNNVQFLRRANGEWIIDGHASFEIKDTSGTLTGSGSYFQDFHKPIVGRTYTASCLMDAHRCTGRLILVFYSSSGSEIGWYETSHNGGGTKKLVVTGTAPTGTVRARVSLHKSDKLADVIPSYLFFDNVKLEEGDVATPYIENYSSAETINNSVQQARDYNGVKIDSDNGVVVTRGDNKVRTLLNATDGIKIQNHNGTSWQDAFFADTNGNLVNRGFLQVGSGNSIFKADNSGIYLGSSNFADAKFKVDLAGNATAASMTLTDSDILGGEIQGAKFVATTDNSLRRIEIDEGGLRSYEDIGTLDGVTLITGTSFWYGNAGEMVMFSHGSRSFSMRGSGTTGYIETFGTMNIGSNNYTTNGLGTWNFSTIKASTINAVSTNVNTTGNWYFTNIYGNSGTLSVGNNSDAVYIRGNTYVNTIRPVNSTISFGLNASNQLNFTGYAKFTHINTSNNSGTLNIGSSSYSTNAYGNWYFDYIHGNGTRLDIGDSNDYVYTDGYWRFDEINATNRGNLTIGNQYNSVYTYGTWYFYNTIDFSSASSIKFDGTFASTLPSSPAGYININVNGVSRKLYYFS